MGLPMSAVVTVIRFWVQFRLATENVLYGADDPVMSREVELGPLSGGSKLLVEVVALGALCRTLRCGRELFAPRALFIVQR